MSAGIPFNPSNFPLPSKPTGYFIGYTVKFNVQKFTVLPTECIIGFFFYVNQNKQRLLLCTD